jgi:DNA-binding transcriptional ArsR family regulator
MHDGLNPTLWRTCRMLANARRLKIIRHLIDNGPITLTELATATSMSLPACSQYTRQITARGLCREIRKGTYAFFDLYPDPSIPYSAQLLQAIIAALLRTKPDFTEPIADLTAYTHVRRIMIVNYLVSNDSSRLCEMQQALQISESALLRHLNKLLSRNLVSRLEDEHYCLLKPPTPLAKKLLTIATGSYLHTS